MNLRISEENTVLLLTKDKQLHIAIVVP